MQKLRREERHDLHQLHFWIHQRLHFLFKRNQQERSRITDADRHNGLPRGCPDLRFLSRDIPISYLLGA